MNVVIVNCFDTYEHRVDLLHEVLDKKGHTVKVLTSDFRHFEKCKRVEPKKDFVFFNTKPYLRNLSYSRLISHKQLANDIFEFLEQQRDEIDLLWVLVPPNSFVKNASAFKRSHKNVRLVFDLIDLWPETMPIGSIKCMFPFSIWKNLRDKHIRSADIVVTECSLYQEKLKTVLSGIDTETLYLARPLVEYKPSVVLPDDRVNLCYLGSINNIIDIDMISSIISHTIKYQPVELHIVGDGERKDEFFNSAKKAGATVYFHGKVYDRDEKQQIFDSCHYGLNIMKHSVCVGLTMKSMDYMEFGLPIINNIKGDTWQFIDHYKIGVNVDSNLAIPKEYDYEFRSRTRSFFEKELTISNFERKVTQICLS